jgi:hypothetical protein
VANDDDTYNAFMAWYEKYGSNANLRMAFDAGYNACEKGE